MKKKVRKRVILVTTFITAFILYGYISIRGEYLQILGIGQKYVNKYIIIKLTAKTYILCIKFCLNISTYF